LARVVGGVVDQRHGGAVLVLEAADGRLVGRHVRDVAGLELNGMPGGGQFIVQLVAALLLDVDEPDAGALRRDQP
jgi:hypothetical protein